MCYAVLFTGILYKKYGDLSKAVYMYMYTPQNYLKTETSTSWACGDHIMATIWLSGDSGENRGGHEWRKWSRDTAARDSPDEN